MWATEVKKENVLFLIISLPNGQTRSGWSNCSLRHGGCGEPRDCPWRALQALEEFPSGIYPQVGTEGEEGLLRREKEKTEMLSAVPRPGGNTTKYATSYFRKSLKSLRTQISLCLLRSPRRPVGKMESGESTFELAFITFARRGVK